MINRDYSKDRNYKVHGAKKDILFIIIFFLLILSTISINPLIPAYALEVKPGDTLTFEIINSSTSIGD